MTPHVGQPAPLPADSLGGDVLREAHSGRRWRQCSRAQPVPWPDEVALQAAERQLAQLPPLVDVSDCERLRTQLARSAAAGGFVLQGGPCAESFRDSDADVDALVALLRQLSSRLGSLSAGGVVTVARLAGQYAKPRSATTERIDGEVLPVFRGHAVHDDAPTAQARRPDPRRLLEAYHRSARTLQRLGAGLFSSHEALLLEYEEALARRLGRGGEWYAGSAHSLWLGDRTRQLDGAHLAFLADVMNPVAVKLGPSATADEVVELCHRLNPRRRPGRLVLVTRLGATGVHAVLPALLAAARTEKQPVTWLCDPMHANTRSDATGAKYRLMPDLITELAQTAATHRAAGTALAGLHLEVTAEDVQECVDDVLEPRRSTSLCDPRVNARQAGRLVDTLLRTGSVTSSMTRSLSRRRITPA